MLDMTAAECMARSAGAESVQSCGVVMLRERVVVGPRLAESLCANDGMRLLKCH